MKKNFFLILIIISLFICPLNVFANEVNDLLNLSYSEYEIYELINNLSKSEIEDIKKNNIVLDLSKYEEKISFDISKIIRYQQYKNQNLKIENNEVVWNVNLNLDYQHFQEIEKVRNPDSLLAIANKFNIIDEDYEPSDLVEIPDGYDYFGDAYLRRDTLEAFMQLVDYAKKKNIKFWAGMSYRSFQTQSDLYLESVESRGSTIEADKFCARAGHSEHQLGNSVDVIAYSMDEYIWISNNAHLFGFIIRYPEEKTYLTGYSYEWWHIRYVGVKAASYIYENSIILEEYMLLYSK